MFLVDRRCPGIVVQGRSPKMPIVEWWDLWYRQIPGTAQLVDCISRGVQRDLRELSNAVQDSPAAQPHRSTPLESSPAVTAAPHARRAAERFEEFYGTVLDRPLGAPGASESSVKPAKFARLPAPPRAQETRTPGSKMVPKSLVKSTREDLLAPKGKRPKPEASHTKAQVSVDKKLQRKAKSASGAASKKRKIARDSSDT